MPQVRYTADGLPYYDATDQQTQPYFAQPTGAMLPAPGNPAQPSEGWNQGVRDTLHGMTIGPVQDAAKALQGGLTPNEAQDFAFGAALGLLPMGRGLRPAQGIRAYHGSPHDFDRFDMSKIGTGEGAQAYGHGLYFAENPAVAADYKSKLSMLANVNQSAVDSNALYYLQRNKFDKAAARAELEDALRMKLPDGHPSVQAINSYNPGKMYEVNINAHPDQFLDWDKPLSGQNVISQLEILQQLQEQYNRAASMMRGAKAQDVGELTGRDLAERVLGGGQRTSDQLREAGIPGIKYLDQGSRTAGEGSRNYVVFDDKLIDIIKKYGWAAVAPMLGLTAENLPIPKAQAPQFQ
jgi:hypothetical protein